MVGDESLKVTHLQFVDDTILFLKANPENICKIVLCLKIFHAISGLKVNMSKTCMVGIHIVDNKLASFAEIMGCQVGRWSLHYLGMSLGGNPKFVFFFLGPNG